MNTESLKFPMSEEYCDNIVTMTVYIQEVRNNGANKSIEELIKSIIYILNQFLLLKTN